MNFQGERRQGSFQVTKIKALQPITDNRKLMANRFLGWITPNQLTSVRILAIPVLLYLIYRNDPLSTYFAIGLFFIACVTDFWDGYLARHRGEISLIGKLLDPIADKMLIAAMLTMLTYMGTADVVPTILILMREFAVSGLRQIAAAEGVVISAVNGAKYKTTFQMLAVGFILGVHVPFAIPVVQIGNGILWFAMVWTLWTGYGYFRGYFRAI